MMLMLFHEMDVKMLHQHAPLGCNLYDLVSSKGVIKASHSVWKSENMLAGSVLLISKGLLLSTLSEALALYLQQTQALGELVGQHTPVH